MEATELLTVGALSKRLNEPQHRVVYILNSRGIEPVARIGNLRVYKPGVVDQLRHELRRIDRSRGVAFA